MPPLDTRKKILPLERLRQAVADLRAQGRTVVLTNGAFDLLHAGHVRYLETARSSGDVLVVALNSDSSVRTYKASNRPLNPENDRAQVLAALEAVDFVTVFDTPTAEHVVEALRPDIYVKGGDYSADPASDRFPPEGRIVQAHGGKVQVVEYVPGRSTTNLIERIQRPNSSGHPGDR